MLWKIVGFRFLRSLPNVGQIWIMWGSGGSFDIRDLGINIVMLLFDDEDDLKRVLK